MYVIVSTGSFLHCDSAAMFPSRPEQKDDRSPNNLEEMADGGEKICFQRCNIAGSYRYLLGLLVWPEPAFRSAWKRDPALVLGRLLTRSRIFWDDGVATKPALFRNSNHQL